MEPELLLFDTPRSARVALLGQPGPEIREVLILLHGYRQLAVPFLRKFESLAAPGRLLAAPEGLSRFYLEGYSGRVGASWMTAEDRVSEIADQLRYLDRLSEILSEGCPSLLSLHILGFSQGAATAWRWIARGAVAPASLTLWCGSVPAEFGEALLAKLGAAALWQVNGSEDAFFSPEMARQHADILRQQLPHLQTLSFSGRHEVPPDALSRWAALLLRPQP